MPTLADLMPHEFLEIEAEGSPARRHSNVEVIKQHYSCIQRWPGKQKYVQFWCVLANGRAVGWNENPATGWSFPLIRYSA